MSKKTNFEMMTIEIEDGAKTVYNLTEIKDKGIRDKLALFGLGRILEDRVSQMTRKSGYTGLERTKARNRHFENFKKGIWSEKKTKDPLAGIKKLIRQAIAGGIDDQEMVRKVIAPTMAEDDFSALWKMLNI